MNQGHSPVGEDGGLTRDGTPAALGPRHVFVALLGLAAAVWVGTVLNRALDPDESQHLHAAWLVAQGRVPFAEFWEHHTPLLYYLLAPLTWGFTDSPGVYLAARAAMAVTAGATLILIYRLAGRLSRPTAMAAVILLALQPRFVEHMTQVRPDVPALAGWVATLLALVTWRERGAAAWLWASGLALGVAGAFTPKAAYGGLGILAGVAVAGQGAAPRGTHRVAASLARVVGGAALPLLALLTALGLHGGSAAIGGFVEHVLGQSLNFADFTREAPVSEEGAGFLVLALGGVALTVRHHGAAAVRHPLHGPLLLSFAVTSVVLMLPTTPAVYRHAWLPVLAIGAVYAGLALSTAIERAWTGGGRTFIGLAMLALVVGVAGPAWVSIQNALRDGTSDQFRIMRLELRHACPGEPVLDGTALYVFRPAAYRYRTLIRGVRLWIANGVIPEEQIVEDLRRTRPRVGYADARVRALVGPVATFLDRHYVLTPDGLLVAGAAVPVSGAPTGGRAYVELLLRGAYRLTASPGVALAIDGVAVRPGLLHLDKGRHEITWIGPQGTIRLAALTCPERQALAPR